MTVKNGVVYGDALSAQEKKRIVMQKKKDRKAKKVRKSAQQTIPYVEMCLTDMRTQPPLIMSLIPVLIFTIT